MVPEFLDDGLPSGGAEDTEQTVTRRQLRLDGDAQDVPTGHASGEGKDIERIPKVGENSGNRSDKEQGLCEAQSPGYSLAASNHRQEAQG
jgi:hypothetical protein